MKIRRILILVLSLVLALVLFGCDKSSGGNGGGNGDGEGEIKITYDDDGKKVREDHYDDEGNLEQYVLFTYNTDGALELKTRYSAEGVKYDYTVYSYRDNGKLLSEYTVAVDESGKQVGSYTVEYYESGARQTETGFNADGKLITKQLYSESGACVYSEAGIFDDGGNYLGKHVVEHTEEMLVIGQADYDAEDNLINKSTFSYHDNGIMKENKQVNGKGEIIFYTVCDENGQETYRETRDFHDNGALSQHSKTEDKNGISYSVTETFDESGKLVTRENTERTKENIIKSEIVDAEGQIIYYKDSERLEEQLIGRDGAVIGKRFVEYYANGEMKTEKEIDLEDRVTLLRQYAENRVILVNESRTYNAEGNLIEHSYEERRINDIVSVSNRIVYDDKGVIIEKSIANYDEYGNVILDERMENYELMLRIVAEYYGKEKPKRVEQYQHMGATIQTRIEYFDEEGRTTERYDCDRDLEGNIMMQNNRKYKYNSAGSVIYEEHNDGRGDLTVNEYFDDGTLKSEKIVSDNGMIQRFNEYNESGELVRSNYVSYNEDGTKIREEKSELVDGKLLTSRDMYIYDENGVLQRLLHEGSDGASTTEYHPNGQVSSFTKFADEMGNRQLYSEGFDENGNKIGRTEYDENNEPVFSWQKREDCEETVRYENRDVVYVDRIDANGRTVTEFYPRNQLKKQSQYNLAGQLLEYFECYENGQSKLSISYDEDGNVLYRLEWKENGEPIV